MAKGISIEKAEEIRLARGIGKGTKLRVLRVQRGLSQKELAQQSGVPIRTLQKFENIPHMIDSTKLATYCRLCEALDCKLTDIIESDELIERFNKIK